MAGELLRQGEWLCRPEEGRRSGSKTCPVAGSDALQQLPEQASDQRLTPADLGMVQGCSQVSAAELHDQHMCVSLHAVKMRAVWQCTVQSLECGWFKTGVAELVVQVNANKGVLLTETHMLSVCLLLWEPLKCHDGQCSSLKAKVSETSNVPS